MASEHNKTAYSSFLGTGWSFPPRFSRDSGSVEMSTDEEDIQDSLKILLGTTAGERLMHPKYGLNLQELLFEPMNTTMQTLLKDRLKTVILVYEPRINLLSVDLDTTQLVNGRLNLILNYQVRATNSRFNLVYPFYLNDGNEVASSLPAGV
jgi:hypothetical protein